MAWVFSPVVLEALECFQGNLIWAFLSRLHLTHHNVVPPEPFVVQKALRIKPIKIPIKSNCFLFLKVKLCFSRLNRTQTWTLERKLTRQETHLLGAIVCCPLRFPPQAALVLAVLSWRVYYSLESQKESSQALGKETLATTKEGWGHVCNLSPRKAEEMGFVGSKPPWST